MARRVHAEQHLGRQGEIASPRTVSARNEPDEDGAFGPDEVGQGLRGRKRGEVTETTAGQLACASQRLSLYRGARSAMHRACSPRDRTTGHPGRSSGLSGSRITPSMSKAHTRASIGSRTSTSDSAGERCASPSPTLPSKKLAPGVGSSQEVGSNIPMRGPPAMPLRPGKMTRCRPRRARLIPLEGREVITKEPDDLHVDGRRFRRHKGVDDVSGALLLRNEGQSRGVPLVPQIETIIGLDVPLEVLLLDSMREDKIWVVFAQ